LRKIPTPLKKHCPRLELLDLSHVVRLIEQATEAPRKRGPYKKKAGGEG
jgi:hypothetical protein